MQRVFVYILALQFLCAGVLCAAEEGVPCSSECANDPPGECSKPCPRYGGVGPVSDQSRSGKSSNSAESGSSDGDQERNNSVKSRWQLDIGGSVIMDVGRTH